MANSRRAWFQIHLSTAIAMMFVVGGFIYLNSLPVDVRRPPNRSLQTTYRCYGWPCSAIEYRMDFKIAKVLTNTDSDFSYEPVFQPPRIIGLIVNLVVMTICLVWIGFSLERPFRRREARAP